MTTQGAIIIEALFLILLFALGLVFGSFANVVIWRFPRGESLSHPDSHCPVCAVPIQWYDNVPVVSWLVLLGRCRSCGVGISFRYPLVETVSGLLWLAAGLRFGMTLQTVAAVAFFYILMILAFIDIDTMRLPNPIVSLLAIIGVTGAAASQLMSVPIVPLLAGGGPVELPPLGMAVGGAVICALPALLLSIIVAAILKRPALGLGDVKLLGVMGIFLSAYGLLALFIGSLIGAMYGLLARRRANSRVQVKIATLPESGIESEPGTDTVSSQARRSDSFPFGPALVMGSVVVALFGPQMWNWYRSLFIL